MRHIIPISGKDSAATAIVQIAKEPDLPYEFVFNPTGSELPAVYDWLDKMSVYLGSPIKLVGSDLIDQVNSAGFLPSAQARYCTRLCKIQPLEEYLSGTPATVYYGLRFDEPQRVGYSSRSKNITIAPSYPLRDMEINLPLVWKILDDRDLLPPFFEWSQVTEIAKSKMGDSFPLSENLHPWEYQQLFSWRTRQFNCSWCFFQRHYEFIGLYDNHPDKFWEAVKLEESTGGKDFTLIRNNPLRQLIKRADEIREKRAKAIVKQIYSANQGRFPFMQADELQSTSCGFFCGK